MYLNAKRYLMQYPEDGADFKISNAVGLMPIGKTPNMRVKYIVCEAIYWRKANAIHKWFVDHCQGGVDDCEEYYVGREHLEALLADIQKILADHSKAPDVLPTQSGFFFGSTDFDEWFWADMERTEVLLKELLNNPEYDRWDFTYRSSW
jgi:hypothetical protein